MANLVLSVLCAFAEFDGVPKALLAREYGIGRETVYQYLRHAKLE